MASIDDVKTLLEAVNTVDEITEIKIQDKIEEGIPTSNDINMEETWETSDYKHELYTILGKKVVDAYNEDGKIEIDNTTVAPPIVTEE
jgi:hypothetical protein